MWVVVWPCQVSKTFDPYFSVSLPLAKEDASAVALLVAVYPAPPRPPPLSTPTEKNNAGGSGRGGGGRGVRGPARRMRAFTLSVPRSAPAAALRQHAAAASGIAASRLVLAEIHAKGFYKFFGDLDPVSDITKADEVRCRGVQCNPCFKKKKLPSLSPQRCVVFCATPLDFQSMPPSCFKTRWRASRWTTREPAPATARCACGRTCPRPAPE